MGGAGVVSANSHALRQAAIPPSAERAPETRVGTVCHDHIAGFDMLCLAAGFVAEFCPC